MSNAHDKNVMLARLRVSVCRLKLLQADIEEVGALLSTGRITPDSALHWLWQSDVLDLCLTPAELAEEVDGDTGSAA